MKGVFQSTWNTDCNEWKEATPFCLQDLDETLGGTVIYFNEKITLRTAYFTLEKAAVATENSV